MSALSRSSSSASSLPLSTTQIAEGEESAHRKDSEPSQCSESTSASYRSSYDPMQTSRLPAGEILHKLPSSSSCSTSSSELDGESGTGIGGHLHRQPPSATNRNTNTNSSNKLYLYIENTLNDETIPILANPGTTVKQIYAQLVKRGVIPSQHARVVFIHKGRHQVLHPSRSLKQQQVGTLSTLLLLQKGPKSKLACSSRSNSGDSLPASPQKQHKLTFVCSFGAPYNRKKINSSYHAKVSLDEYAAKIKEYFAIAADIQITFNFDDKPCVGEARKCGIQQLGIYPNATVYAESIGITLTLKHYQCPENIKLIQMYRDFTYQMLIEQINFELGIFRAEITALIGKNFTAINSDSKCRQIEEYQTITILTRCDALHCVHCEHAPKTVTTPFAHKMATDSSFDYHPMQRSENRANDDFAYNQYHLARIEEYPEQRYLAEIPNHHQNHMNYEEWRGAPQCEDQNAFFFYDPYPNYHDYSYEYHYQTAQTSSTIAAQQPAPNGYYHHEEEDGRDYPYRRRVAAAKKSKHTMINGKAVTKKFLKPIPKLCRYGGECRYYRNPHISGPCRYYHPPPGPPPWKTHYSLHHGILKKNKYKNNYIVSEGKRSKK